MSELSGFWTTTGTATGDQVASYNQVHWSMAVRVMAACHGFEGVAPDYLNGLACTATAANTVSLNTGGAIVDGKWYLNDAAQDINIPSASGGGNTRIDRIVLRCTWASYNVSVYRIAGTDDPAPTAPAITQNTGSTYDILLYQALVDTVGEVTLTSEREFPEITTTSLADDAVTGAKIADNVIDSNHLAAGSVDNVHMAADSIDSAQYVDGSIDTAHIADAQITLGKMAANSVDSDQYVDGSIDTAHIADGQITLGKMAANSVDSDQYVDGSIDTAHIADSQITLGKMAANSVDSDQYVDGSIDAVHLASAIVDDTKVSNRVIKALKRLNSAVVTDDWNAVGTTEYDIEGVKAYVGCQNCSSAGYTTITFPAAFSANPVLFMQVNGADLGHPIYASLSETSVGVGVKTAAGSFIATTVNWMAIGPG